MNPRGVRVIQPLVIDLERHKNKEKRAAPKGCHRLPYDLFFKIVVPQLASQGKCAIQVAVGNGNLDGPVVLPLVLRGNFFPNHRTNRNLLLLHCSTTHRLLSLCDMGSDPILPINPGNEQPRLKAEPAAAGALARVLCPEAHFWALHQK